MSRAVFEFKDLALLEGACVFLQPAAVSNQRSGRGFAARLRDAPPTGGGASPLLGQRQWRRQRRLEPLIGFRGPVLEPISAGSEPGERGTVSVRSQYPAAQSRPQRPDWRVSLTTQERPRRPSSPGSLAEPSRAGRPAARARGLGVPRATPGRGLQGAAPRGDGALGASSPGPASCRGPVPLGMRPLLSALQAQLSGPRLGVRGPACPQRPSAQVHARPGPWSPPDRPGLTQVRPGPLRALALGAGDLPGAPPSLAPREPGLLACPPAGHEPRTAAGRGAGPPPRPRGRGRGSVGAPTPRPRRAPPLRTLGPGLWPGAVTTPFWLVISSSPRPARPGKNRTPPSWSPTKRSPFLVPAVQPASPFGACNLSLVEDCQPCAFLCPEAAHTTCFSYY
nr:uncharacterized protein LOC112914157 [Vulpes vulpes]